MKHTVLPGGHTVVYRDLRDYVKATYRANDSDYRVQKMYTAWNRFAGQLPEMADTPISDQATDKFVERFEQTVTGLVPVTIENYVASFRSAVAMFQAHIDDTGGIGLQQESSASEPAATEPEPGEAAARSSQPDSTENGLVYADIGEWVVAYREDNGNDATAKRWNNAYNAITKRLPAMLDRRLDPEATEQLLGEFMQIATDIVRATRNGYCYWFRDLVKFYCGVVGHDYIEVDVEERRRRRLAAEAEAKAAQQPRPKPKTKAKPKTKQQRTAKPATAAAPPPVEAQPSEPVDPPLAPAVVEESAPEPAPVPMPVSAPAPTTAGQLEPMLPSTVQNWSGGDEDLHLYWFNLRRGTKVVLSIPEDLTVREAERLGQWVRSLVIES